MSIEALANPADNYWIKILGKQKNCQQAFRSIQQLPVTRRERNDIIKVCLRYGAYLQNISPTEITPEEQEFMKTLTEIDAFLETYPAELLAAEERGKREGQQEGKREGQIELAKTMICSKFEAAVLTPAVADLVSQITEQQLESFTVAIFQWQEPAEMLAWLSSTPSSPLHKANDVTASEYQFLTATIV